MKNDLFRKQAMDHVIAPDQLNDYIKVVPMGAWLIVGAVVLVIAAVVLFLSTTDLDLLGLIFN